MRTAPTNSDDVIDSRDVIARIEELESEREALQEAATEARSEYREEANLERHDELARAADDAAERLAEWDESDEGKELAALLALQEEAGGYAPDWRHGCALIRDSYFQDYARQLADDLGAIDRDAGWPMNCVDWKEAADQLQMDYTAVEFDGVTYWTR